MTRQIPVAEKDFQQTLVEALELLGWACWHTRPAMNRKGEWRTPTTSKGIPDLLALRGPWLLVIEVKSDAGKLTDEQVTWLSRFAQLPCARAWVLRPKDPWEPIVAWMQHPSTAPAYFGWPFDVGSIGDRPDWTLSSFEDGKPSVPGQTASS